MNIFNNNNFAGWAAIASAIVTIPVIVLAFYTGFSEGLSGEKDILITAANMALNSIYLLIFVIIFVNFKKLLNSDLGLSNL